MYETTVSNILTKSKSHWSFADPHPLVSFSSKICAATASFGTATEQQNTHTHTKALTTLFYIHDLANSHNWLMSRRLTRERE